MSERPYSEEQARRVEAEIAAIREATPEWLKTLSDLCIKRADLGHRRRREKAARDLTAIDRQIQEVCADLGPITEIYNRLQMEHDRLISRKIAAEMTAHGRSRTDEAQRLLEDYRTNSLS